MIPPLIVQSALDKNITLIAICDHNSTANIASVQKAALGTPLTVIAGMELQTREEVHCLCLFDSLEQAKDFQLIVDSNLPPIENNPDLFGEQFIVDETGDFISREQRMLSSSTSLSLAAAWNEVNKIGGIFIPAHIDRQAFGLIANLGFIPEDIPLRILEISRFITPEIAYKKYPQSKNYALFQNGDVHYLNDFLGAMFFDMENVSLKEIQMAAFNQESRRLRITSKPQ